ncbi:MAG: diguanylate cyclase [Eubacteriales bacterium]|nr:diguanylate cyclase [Eubacteriales bacterium]
METVKKQIILVVDDSLLICKQIRTALKEEPVFVCEAHTGEEAIEAVSQYQPDMILLDVVLPDIEGYELFGKLKEQDKNNASIIFLTSKDKDEDVVRGFSMGACDYIKKPFVQGEFRSRVNIHLLLKKQKDELARQNKELRTNMEKLNFMAFRDGLTGLYNRRYVVGDLVEEIRVNNEEKKNVLIMADIDDFKKINDTYGHDAGDMALVCLANILEGLCREHKVVRWGGEEFLIVLFDVTESEAWELSESIRKEVESFPIFHGEKEFSMTITLGLHIYEEDEGIEESIQYADKALYKGKRSGKNCSVWYDKIN